MVKVLDAISQSIASGTTYLMTGSLNQILCPYSSEYAKILHDQLISNGYLYRKKVAMSTDEYYFTRKMLLAASARGVVIPNECFNLIPNESER